MSRRSARGFTLIEILMALMVLAIGLASVLAVFVAGVRSSKRVVDESAAALSASAVLARILAEDEVTPYGERDFLAKIETARQNGTGSLWINPSGQNSADPVSTANASSTMYCWRARASRFRGDVANPIEDMSPMVELKTGRVSSAQMNNPDSEELWRVTVEIYRANDVDGNGVMPVNTGAQPVDTYQTYVCTAHR